MTSLAEFFAMGGYGAFVWPAFGLSALILIIMFVASLRFLRSQTRLLEDLESSETK